MKTITIIIPAYNESKNLPNTISALNPLIDNNLIAQNYNWEILVVNDGSSDETERVLSQLHDADSRVHFVSLSRNFGKENAMLAGLDFANGDAVIIMDADLQHPIEAIPLMIAEWENGYDDVYGRRITRGKEPYLRKILTRTYYKLLQKASSVDILPNVGDFRLLDRKCVNALRKLRETQRYSKGLFCWIGFSKKEIEFEQKDRSIGQSNFSYAKLFQLAIEGITSFTTAPLRFASVIGILTAGFALFYLLFIFFKTIVCGEPVTGFPTIMCVMLLLGGFQLIGLGIIGEYVGRIFNETKHRPVYIAKSFDGKPIDS